MTRNSRLQFGFVLAMATMLATALGSSQQAAAQTIGVTGYRLNISPSDQLLHAVEGAIDTGRELQIAYDVACDNPINRTRARNKPAIELINDSATALLTQMTLTINNPGAYVFGTGDGMAMEHFTNYIQKSLYGNSGVQITGTSVDSSSKTLTINFANFTPGSSVIFNIDLDTTDPDAFQYPDYRGVLFGVPPVGTGSPATYNLVFSSPTNPAVVRNTPGTLAKANSLDPSSLDGIAYYNTYIRPYHAMDKMEIVPFGAAIPEPTSMAMLALGVAAVAFRRRAG